MAKSESNWLPGKAGLVLAVCVSKQKGTRKQQVASIRLRVGYGVEGDAHGGSARQVSLLCESSIAKLQGRGLEVGPGDFAENITVSGLEANHFVSGTRVSVGNNVELRVTEIGKDCHSACEIRRITGTCIMPKEGIFAEVVAGGEVKPSDRVVVGDGL